jgi:hypothetical protein
MSNSKEGEQQHGGVHISGHSVEVSGHVVGRDQVIHGDSLHVSNVMTHLSGNELNEIFGPLLNALHDAPPDKQKDARQKAEVLRLEVAKGEKAEDTVVAKLVDSLVKLVPSAVSAVIGMFATPILSGIAGPVTKFALDRMKGE